MADMERAALGISHEEGAVFIRVQETLIQLDPEGARKMGTSLFIKAAHAEGREAPELVVLKQN